MAPRWLPEDGDRVVNVGAISARGQIIPNQGKRLRFKAASSRAGAGIVELHHRAYNQDGVLVAECRRQAFMRMRTK